MMAQEPWLAGLLAFHLLLLLSCIAFRKSWNYNFAVLLVAGEHLPLVHTLFGVACSEDLASELLYTIDW